MQIKTEKIEEKAQQVSQVVEDNQNVGTTERIISGVAALLLTIYALKKKNTLLGKGLTAVSGMLLTRATTGFCPVNKAIGRNSLLAGRS
ncbi:DUF2892 domain-containing protein [Dyadobacter sp. CY261]|uniref:YgaP family membrane protein n=1 Tax=Dyadobacter sp. CY261 TaxID=2907203 RepID=UPI001F2D0D42|nr:DUF2892 domain-containing protein [Dyadobacter sp. CY261]MCF0074171.1 DUF2892 domain-containing protein [Dyadobacter sp. CY261]